MNTPLVILFFNRPDSVKRLIQRLSEVKPSRLYLVSDGARSGRADESAKVNECRALFDDLPWRCEIKRNFADKNLGCRQRIISGLDWVFEQEERAIILEDDCIPIVDFFPFVEQMLEHYKSDTRIMSVCGTNWCPHKSWPDYSITFSRYAVISGWATWRRAWTLMDRELSNLEFVKRDHLLRYHLRSRWAEWYWLYVLTKIRTSWGYRWEFTSFIQNGLHVLPKDSLVDNIGMSGTEATHTTQNPYDWPVPVATFAGPYRIPEFVCANGRLDKWVEGNHFSRSIGGRLRWLVKKLLKIN